MEKPLSQELQRLETLTRSIQFAENQLNLALSLAEIGIWTLNVPNDILDWDDRMMRLFEVDRADFKPNYAFFQSCLHPDDVKSVNASVKEAMNGEDFDYSYRVKCRDGGYKKIRGKGKVMFGSCGKPVDFVGVCLVDGGCD